MTGSFKLVKKIDAKTAAWNQHHWELKDGIVQELKEDGNYALARFDRLILDIPETPEAFKKKEKKPEEMSYWHLKQFAERVRAEGYDATEYFVNVHLKIAFPFIVVIMVLTGDPCGPCVIEGRDACCRVPWRGPLFCLSGCPGAVPVGRIRGYSPTPPLGMALQMVSSSFSASTC